jgi:NADH-quinone oxidoreductase subunit F/NAD(P)H dehydrogenase (quinone)/NADP-reducing hydrogenase subunit HndC
MICAGTGCVANGSLKVKDALETELIKRNLQKEVKIVLTGCNGFCAKGPVMVVYPEDIFYQLVKPEDVPHLVEEHFIKGRPVQKFLYTPPADKNTIPVMNDIPFFKHQVLRALRNRSLIDAEKIEEYIARDGYMAAAKALTEMTPEQIVVEMKKSGLRGRGGAGFLTGLKWELCARVSGDIKYILCNGDEGDPGAFMDRSVMEADPHSVLEGMIIAAKAINAHYGYIYVRAEYPLAVQRLQLAIESAKDHGLLGKDILGTGFDLDIEIYQGAGAFVCGEETALMASIEGKRGMPRAKPPFPAVKGLWQRPSVLNNVETFANIPPIILHGADWYASLGTEKSKGTKVFALSGALNNIGLVEVPMGTPLKTIIYDIGGGIKNNRKFKAVQMGGPSGGCIPGSLIDTPVDFENINKTGAIMGSGGMVVMDETTCMPAMAKFFLEFTEDESCGKCVPCRIGNKTLLTILQRITNGEGREGDIELLLDLSQQIKDTSLCGLGQTSPNPVLTTIKYFRDEYEAHIKEHRCPARVCTPLVKFVVDQSKCKKCGQCFKACPAGALKWEKGQVAYIDPEKCTKCKSCIKACRFWSID